MKHEEYKIQCMIVEWFRLQYPNEIIKGDHGGIKMSIGNAVKAKRSGCTVKGYPDLFIAVPKKGCHGLYIELKTKTGRLSKEQREMLLHLDFRGYMATFAHGFDECKQLIENYMNSEG